MPARTRRTLAAIPFLLAALTLAAPAAPGEAPPADQYGDPLPPGAVARMGSARLRHPANAVAFAPDGKTFATAGRDNCVRLWSAADGKEVRAFKGHPQNVTGVAFSADGKKLYSSSLDGAIREWDPAEGKEVRSFGPKPAVPLQALVVHPTEPLALTWDPGSGTVREWDLKEGKETRNTAALRGWAVTLSPDGRHFAANQNDFITLHDLTGKELHRFQLPRRVALRLAFSADGKTLAAGGGDALVRLWNVADGKELRAVETVPGVIALSPRGRYLAVKGGDRSVRVYGVASGKELRQLDATTVAANALAFSPDEKALAVCEGSTVRLWDLEKSRPVFEAAGHVGTVADVRYSPDGKRLTTTSYDGTGYWWDAATGKALASWNNNKPATGLKATITPDGRSFFAPSFPGVTRCDFEDGRVTERPWPGETSNLFSCVAISPDGKVLAMRSRVNTIQLLDDAGKELGRLPNEAYACTQFAVAPDGKQIVGGGRDMPVRIWEVPSGTELRRFEARGRTLKQSYVSALALSPDGRGVLTVYQEAALWEAATGRERWRAQPPGVTLTAAVFSPDGRMAALGTITGIVYVVETASGAELGKFEGHRGGVYGLNFTADGTRLASGGDDGTVLVWDTAELSKKSRPAAAKLDAEQLEGLWRDLSARDSAQAYKAVRALASEQGVAHLKAKVRVGGKDEAERIQRLIADLDSDDFATREKAHKELEGLGGAAVPEMRKALAAKPSAEVRTRLERLLEPFKDKNEVPADRLREMRVVEALEYAGTAEAAELLKKLAAGDAKAPLTQDAKATLERLTKRDAKP
jgi:WD40 repeat protein